MRQLFFAIGLAVCGCNQDTVIPLPEAGAQDACAMHAVTFCDAAVFPNGCIGGDASNSFVAFLPTDTAYPVGCSANIIASQRDPVSGSCELASACTCALNDASADASPAWQCSP